MLTCVRLAHFDAGDLRDRVPLIGWLERTGQQRRLVQRLRREARIDAARAEEAKLARAVAVGGVDQIRLDLEVVANEVGRVRVVGGNAADLGGGHKDVLRPLAREEAIHGRPVAQIDCAARRRQDVGVAACSQRAADRGADEAARAGHEYAGVLVHS